MTVMTRLRSIRRTGRFIGRISVFERAVALAIVAIAVTVGLVMLFGDNVGVQVSRYGPVGTGSQTGFVSIQFSEDMDRVSVEERFTIKPQVPGEFSWNGSRLLFRPFERLAPGSTYSVSIASGAQSNGGRELLDVFSFNFSVRGAQVVFLKNEEDGVTKNLWSADPASDDPPTRLTNSETGIAQFDISPDGSRIVYRESDTVGPERSFPQLMLFDVASGQTSQLTFLNESQLSDPAWNYDGTKIAYTRSDTTSAVPGLDSTDVGISIPRVWVLDISQDPMVNQRLLPPESGTSYGPEWSPAEDIVVVGSDPLSAAGGRRATVVDAEQGVLFEVDTLLNTSASFNADGSELLLLVNATSQVQGPNDLWKVEVETGQLEQVHNGPPRSEVRNIEVAWQPGGNQAAVLRRNGGGVTSRTAQLHVVDFETGQSTPMLATVEHDVLGMVWSPSGQYLAIDRFKRFNADGTNATNTVREVIVADIETGELTVLAQGASSPQWMP